MSVFKIVRQYNLITRLSWKKRFTPEERASIQSSSDSLIIDYQDILNESPYINMFDTYWTDVLNKLIELNILTVERKETILLTPVLEEEAYKE